MRRLLDLVVLVSISENQTRNRFDFCNHYKNWNSKF
jgi:hypothetical protein